METAQAQALVQEVKRFLPIELEAADYIARELKRLPKLQSGKFAIRIMRTWGFTRRRFDRLIDYLCDPFTTGLEKEEGFTPAVIAEFFYRCGEVHENGEWKPVESCLRRPSPQTASLVSELAKIHAI